MVQARTPPSSVMSTVFVAKVPLQEVDVLLGEEQVPFPRGR